MTSRFEPVFDFAHSHRWWVAAASYAVATTVSLVLAVLFRFELTFPPDQVALFWGGLPWLILIRTAFAHGFRITVARWRFVGISDVARLLAATFSGTAVYFLFSWIIPLLPALPRSVLLIEAVVTQYLVAGMWIAYRMSYERIQHARHADGVKRRVLMVGAGDAGQMLVREMQRTPTGMIPVGYVDDDPVKTGARIHGVKVWGLVEELPAVVVQRRVDEVVIAVPSADPSQIRRFVDLCEQSGRPFSILPGIAEVLSGEAHLSQVREVRVEDLLGREPVVMELPSVRADLRGMTAMITGAAGSIGSELARQVALHGPSTLVLLDQAETPLYYLDLELRAEFPSVDVVPVIMDVADAEAVESVFERFQPQRVFHAAAYKHVPLMERHPLEAVKNNVVGTWVMADAAGRHGAQRFILVSTDKAVRPANIMGASKRMAELSVLEAQRIHPGTSFGAVRFGNVLGSNGSVLPLFRKQLELGQPLTVTHEAVTRYFMTIPEAVQLILQASTLPELKGHVAMLEMGEPVRILDMARNLLRLVGSPYRPGENVIFTGLRPGEKMEEELVGPEERIVPTGVDKVRLLVSAPDDPARGTWLTELEAVALKNLDTHKVLGFLTKRFPGVADLEVREGSSWAP